MILESPATTDRRVRPLSSAGAGWWGRLQRSVLAPCLVALIACLCVGYGYGRPQSQQGEPSYFIRAGSDFTSLDLLPRGTYVSNGTGYDGQFFFYIAQDPFLSSAETATHLDAPAYRYRRILLPLVAWASSGGNPEVLQWTLPLINLLAILGSGLLLARFLRARDVSPWFSLLYMLSIGMLAGWLNDVADPLAAGLFVAGLCLWADNRIGLALVALGAAPFARELYLLPLAAVAGLELLRWRMRAAAWAVPVLAFGAWSLYVPTLFPPNTREVAAPSPIPLKGVVEKLRNVVEGDILGTANWEILYVLFAVTAWGFLAYRSVSMVQVARERRWPSREQLIPVVALAGMLLVPFLTQELWGNPLSYVRYAAPLSGVLMMIYASTRSRLALGLALVSLALSLANPLIGLAPTRFGPVIAPI